MLVSVGRAGEGEAVDNGICDTVAVALWLFDCWAFNTPDKARSATDSFLTIVRIIDGENKGSRVIKANSLICSSSDITDLD